MNFFQWDKSLKIIVHIANAIIVTRFGYNDLVPYLTYTNTEHLFISLSCYVTFISRLWCNLDIFDCLTADLRKLFFILHSNPNSKRNSVYFIAGICPFSWGCNLCGKTYFKLVLKILWRFVSSVRSWNLKKEMVQYELHCAHELY